jgi:hypothetical protein
MGSCEMGRYVAVALAVGVLAGCGIRADDEPRTIHDEEPIVGAEVSSGSEAAGGERIYLVAPGEERLLRSVPREATSTQNLIEILLAGPNENELEEQWVSQIPPGTRLVSSRSQGSTLFLDLTSQLTELSANFQPQALAQIVYTAAEDEGIEAVQITIDGEQQPLPKGNGDSTTEPLQIYDYPGFVESAQPDYPALPAAG